MAQGQSTTTYDYDANNRLTAEIKNTNGTNQTTKYTYDGNGNQLTKSINGASPDTYTYDEFDRFVESQKGRAINCYEYDADGLRISKSIAGVTTKQYWDGTNIVNEADENGNLKNTYIRGTSLIGVTDASGLKKKYLFNGHGDVVGLTDGNGNVTKSYDYDIFGNEKNIDPNDTNPFRYAGEYYDNETGDYYLRARYYNPADGRFISEDTYEGDVKDPLSLNWYTYCEDDPVNGVDPSGHWTIAVSGGGTLGCGLGFSGSGGVAVDEKGRVLGFFCPGISATTPVAGYGPAVTITNANNVKDLKGFGVNFGGSLCIQVEAQISSSSKGLALSTKANALLPFEVHGTLSYTFGYKLNKKDTVKAKKEITDLLKKLNNMLDNKTKIKINKSLGQTLFKINKAKNTKKRRK